MLNTQLIAQIGLLMFQRLTHLISSGDLLNDRQDEERFKKLSDDYREEVSIDQGDMEWMMKQHVLAYDNYLEALPDTFHETVVNNDTLMSELERSSADFKDASKCFGFNVEDYNNAFLQYVEDIKGTLLDRLSTVQPALKEESERHAIKKICDSLGFQAQITFDDYLQWWPRIPMMAPSTFAAMAETFMKFPNAITEVQLLKLSSVPLMLRYLSPQVVSWVYPMSQYFLSRGGGGTLPRNATSWLFHEIRHQKTSYWTERQAALLPMEVSGGSSIAQKART
jgi:hypothetical protein